MSPRVQSAFVCVCLCSSNLNRFSWLTIFVASSSCVIARFTFTCTALELLGSFVVSTSSNSFQPRSSKSDSFGASEPLGFCILLASSAAAISQSSPDRLPFVPVLCFRSVLCVAVLASHCRCQQSQYDANVARETSLNDKQALSSSFKEKFM